MAEVYAGDGMVGTADGENLTTIMQTEENIETTGEAAEVDEYFGACGAAHDDATIVTSIPVVDVTLFIENFEMTIPEEFLYMLEDTNSNQTKEKVVDIKFLTKLLELKHYVLKSQQFLDAAVDKIVLQQVRIKRKSKRKKRKDPPQEEIEIRKNEDECCDNDYRGGEEIQQQQQQQHEEGKENEALLECGFEGYSEGLVSAIADVVAESTKEQVNNADWNESNLPEAMDSDSDSDSTASESSVNASSTAAVIMPQPNSFETDDEEEEITKKNRRKKAKQPSPSVRNSRSKTTKNGEADNKRKRRRTTTNTEEEISTTRQKRPRACRKDYDSENIFDSVDESVEETPAAQRRKARKSGITTKKGSSGGGKEKETAKVKKKRQRTPRKKNVKPKVAPPKDDDDSEAESLKDNSDSDDASAVVVKETIDTHSHGQAKKWVNCLLQMKEFYDKHGHYNVPADQPEFKTLKTWHTTTCDMGRRYMRGKLPQWKEKFEIVNQQLEGFNWGVIKGTPTSNLYDTSIPWDDYYEMLKEYKEKFGHPNVPLKEIKDEYSNLAGWVSDMRSARNRIVKKNGTSMILTPERFEKLDALGFSWRRKDDIWNDKYERLKRYKEEHGDCLVPKVYPKDKQLGVWVSEMRKGGRRHLAGDKNGYVTEERFKKLDEIGFCWYIPGKKYPENG